jgi:hypothetical protein
MKAIERSIIAAVAAAILLLFLFPPFMCIDAESGGRVHTTLGRRTKGAFGAMLRKPCGVGRDARAPFRPDLAEVNSAGASLAC